MVGTAATTATLEAALTGCPPLRTSARLAELAAAAFGGRGATDPLTTAWWLPGKTQLLAGVFVGGLLAVSFALVPRSPEMPLASPAKPLARLGVEPLEPRDVPATVGLLDGTFGTGGFATVAGAEAYDVVVQADGKVITVGRGGGDFQVVRLNANGTPDTSFGGSGSVRTDIQGAADNARAVAVQADGKIVVAGGAGVTAKKGSTTYRNALVRYNANGTLDQTFGSKGEVVTAGTGGVADMVILPDGRIVTVGFSGTGDLMACRYNANGTLDTSFDGDGKAVVDIAGRVDGARSLAVQADGKIVVSGWTQVTETGMNARALLVRFNSNGSLDTTFDGDGVVFPSAFGATNNENSAKTPTLALQADGKIILGGSGPDGMDYLLGRYNADGSIDTTFGTNGLTQTNFGVGADAIDQIHALVVQADGRIVAAGGSTSPTNSLGTFAVARYTPEGALDTTFGTNGLTTFQSDPSYGGSNRAVAIGPDGKLVAAGWTNGKFVVSRYLAE